MALTTKTTSFGFSNTTDSSNEIVPKALGLTTNYALVSDEADIVQLSNKTCPIDELELVQFRSRNVQKVNSNLNIQYPSPVKAGIQYGVRVEETISTTDSNDASFRVDEPIVLNLSITHPKSGNIDNSIIGTAFLRLVSCLMKEDGSWRFDDLMRSSERPIID